MKEKLANLGALISASMASICCLGPLVLVALGLGGAGFAVGLAKYRPLFLGLTACFLAAAHYLTYRKRKVVCETGRCKWRSGSGRMKVSLGIITGIALLLATFPHWSPFIFREPAAVLAEQTASLTLKISGMHCAACTSSVESALKKVPRVKAVSVDYDQSKATVLIEPGKVNESELREAVQTAGPYQAHIENDK